MRQAEAYGDEAVRPFSAKAGLAGAGSPRAVARDALLRAEETLELAGLAVAAADVRTIRRRLAGVAAKSDREVLNWVRSVSVARSQTANVRARLRNMGRASDGERAVEVFMALSAGALLVLARLLETPGVQVSTDDLHIYAGVSSDSENVIKVYICKIRSVFRKIGIGYIIETERGGYSISCSDAFAVVKAIRSIKACFL
jgi:hypothetical protein